MQNVFLACIIIMSATACFGMIQNLKGVHFDIEPYTLPVWKTNETETFGNYVDLLDKLSAKLAGTGLDLAVDLPFWYFQYNYTRNGRTQPYHEWVIDRTDRVCSMDYRAYAYTNGIRTDGIVRNGMDYVNYATKVGKKVVIIVETTRQEPSYISFYNTTTSYMEQELELAHRNFSTKSGYDSLCIHHRDSWEAMTPDYNVTNGIPRDTFQWATAAAINPATRPAFLQFCKRHNVRTIYFHSESLVKTNQAGLISFIQSAATYGINVELLFGAANWALPGQHDYVLSLVDFALQVAGNLTAVSTTSSSTVTTGSSTVTSGSTTGSTSGSTTGVPNTCSTLPSSLGNSFQDSFTCCYAFSNGVIPTFTLPAPLSSDVTLNSGNPLKLWNGSAIAQGCNGDAYYYEDDDGLYKNTYVGSNGGVYTGINNIYATSHDQIRVRTIQSWQNSLESKLTRRRGILILTCNNGLRSCVRFNLLNQSDAQNNASIITPTTSSTTGSSTVTTSSSTVTTGSSTVTTGSTSSTTGSVATSSTTGSVTTSGSTTSSSTTTGTVTTGNGNFTDIMRINVKITISVPLIPTSVDINDLIHDITHVLGIPRKTIGDITVDLDRSSDSETVITFTLWNVFNGTIVVDPIQAAYNLKNLVENNDPSLQNTNLLAGMSVIDYGTVGYEDSSASLVLSSYLLAFCILLFVA